MTDPITWAFNRGLGPWLTPLRGKAPIFLGWTELPPATEPQVREWIQIGYELGFRCGTRSGLIVIDDDQCKHDASGYTPPPTGLIAESPTGSRHYYYRAPDPCPGNSASKLAPYVDVRGDGGQVVFPGSAHVDTRTPYRWVEQGEPGELPADALAILLPADNTAPAPVHTSPSLSHAPNSNRYAETALTREVARVHAAPEGTRNDALNRAAFSLGQLVAGGELDSHTVTEQLTAAAEIAGLTPRETQATIRSGLGSGSKSPRRAPERPAAGSEPVTTARSDPSPNSSHEPTQPSPDRGYILVPGSHVVPGGEYIEQGTHRFAYQVSQAVPGDLIYRRGETVGEITEKRYQPISHHRLRTIIDRSVPLRSGKPPKDPDDDATLVFRTCTADHAQVVLPYIQAEGGVRELIHLASHPVTVGPTFDFARPGWNPDHSAYLTSDLSPPPLPLDEARAVLSDLVCDFPFQEPADRANFFGLMLTPILRPSLGEPVPMHLITSPMERSGKTKLAELVLGCSVLGTPTPATQLGEREEEREKRIMATMMCGDTLVHLDNLTDQLDSACLASVLTSNVYRGRILGFGKMVAVPNNLTIVGTGNNVHATGEVAKRVVPIRLLPATEAPETRTGFKHSQLRSYVETQRERILGALLGLIAEWKRQEMSQGPSNFGGFERWASVLGGIMRAAGYEEYLANLSDWRGVADESTTELFEFAKKWLEVHGTAEASPAELYALAEEHGFFAWKLAKRRDDHSRKISFGRILSKAADRVVPGPYRVVVTGPNNHRRYRLVTIGSIGSTE